MSEFTLSSKDLVKSLAQLKYIPAKRIHFIEHDGLLYAGIKEAQGVGWIKAGSVTKDFQSFSVDGAQFVSIFKTMEKTAFNYNEGNLSAVAIKGSFRINNFPTERALDFIRNLIKAKAKFDESLNKLLKKLKPALALATSVNTGVEVIQIFATNEILMVVGLAKTNSLGYVGQLPIDDKIRKLIKQTGSSFSWPVEAVKTYIENEDAKFAIDGHRIEVFNKDFYTIFLSKQTGISDTSAVASLLNAPAAASIKLDLADFFNSIARIPGVKILSLQTAKDHLKITGTGFAQIGLKYDAKIVQNSKEEVSFNFMQLRAILSQAKDYKGRIEWGQFLRLKCTTESWTHNFLLAKVYNDED
jgi:hypothetical protein